jgi:hypothetical protein
MADEDKDINNSSKDKSFAKDCSANKGPTDSGRMAIGIAWQVAAAALAVTNAVTSANLADKQMDLAYQYYHLAKNWRDWHKTGYQPLEDKELEDVWNDDFPEAHYDIAIGRASVFAKLQFGDTVRKVMRCTSQYDAGLRSLALAEGAKTLGETIMMSEGVGYRNERLRLEMLKDWRWKRREQVAMRGRNMMAGNVQDRKSVV